MEKGEDRAAKGVNSREKLFSMDEIIENKGEERKIVIETRSHEETFAFGEKLGGMSRPGQIYVLEGDLGVGKTVFTQGFARGLGIAGPVNSPTFTILQVYEGGRLPFYHFDVYRIEDAEEMEEIGYEDCFYGTGVCLIEWGNLIEEILPEEAVWVKIEKDLNKGFDYRQISIGGGGNEGEEHENSGH